MAGKAPREEIRFAVVLNGGVSLAVWMGGVVLELDRLIRERDVYQQLLQIAGCTARADVITGTSAGGVNGAALALSQVNENAELGGLRDLWVEQGQFGELLRDPFTADPDALLNGETYFLPQLREALESLVQGFRPADRGDRPVDLRITTTLLNGVPKYSRDDLGQQLAQSVHQGCFSFRRDPYEWARPPGADATTDDFVDPLVVGKLARAARSSASFPFAFEPSFVQVFPGENDMGTAANWFKDATTDRSRYAVDGGVLVNTPTREALEAIDRMPADSPVRRVMLLVFPHAPIPGQEPKADTADTPPKVTAAAVGVLGAMRSQSDRTFVENVEEHNRTASARRGGRNALLGKLFTTNPDTVVQQVRELSTRLYGHYVDLRILLVAREVALRQQFAPADEAQPSWSFERVRCAAEAAQRQWLDRYGSLPYAPQLGAFPVGQSAEPTWRWGFTMAERLASATLDLLKRLVWVVKEPQYSQIEEARRHLHEDRCGIRRLQEELNRNFQSQRSSKPGRQHWTDRLTYFEGQMRGRMGEVLRAHVNDIGAILEQVQPVLQGIEDERFVLMSGLGPWKALLEGPAQTAPREWLARLLRLEIAAMCLADSTPTGYDQPVELVQVSLQTSNPFAKESVKPEDKASGDTLARFSGFLRRSWRVNDWIWGRLDGTTMLCKVLFDPRRLRRLYELDQPAGTVPENYAAATMDGLVAALFGEAPPQLGRQIAAATKELTDIYTAANFEDLRPSADALAELAAWGLHVRIINEELPVLRQAIEDDHEDGASSNSNGVRFIAKNRTLLERIQGLPQFADSPVLCTQVGMLALAAFDCAKIGDESVGTSDHDLMTGARAALVMANVLHGKQSGLGFARLVTGAVHSIVLVSYGATLGYVQVRRAAQWLRHKLRGVIPPKR